MTTRSPVNLASLALQTPVELASLRDSLKSAAAYPEVQAFQARIAAMGRRPTVEELEVAERWASGKAVRDEEASAAAAARQACARRNPGNDDGSLKGAANA